MGCLFSHFSSRRVAKRSGGGGPSGASKASAGWWRGRGAAGLDETPATKAKRLGRGPFHHLAAQDGPPPPLSRGRMQVRAIPFSRRVFFAPEPWQATARKRLPPKK